MVVTRGHCRHLGTYSPQLLALHTSVVIRRLTVSSTGRSSPSSLSSTPPPFPRAVTKSPLCVCAGMWAWADFPFTLIVPPAPFSSPVQKVIPNFRTSSTTLHRTCVLGITNWPHSREDITLVGVAKLDPHPMGHPGKYHCHHADPTHNNVKSPTSCA